MSELVLDQPLRPLLELVELALDQPAETSQETLGEAGAASISCGFDHRSITALIGLPGAGREALGRLITGEALPLSGAIRLAGLRIERLGAAARLALGITASPRRRPLYPGSVVELLADARSMISAPWWRQAFTYRRSPPLSDRQDIDAILDFLEITPLATRPVASLGGLDARLADLARCLVQRPRVVLLEHPLAGLPAADRQTLSRSFVRLREAELAVIALDDDLATLSRLADRCIVLHHRRLIADAAPATIGRLPHAFHAITGSTL